MPDEDSHLAVHARSQAHDSRQKIAGITNRGRRAVASPSTDPVTNLRELY